MPTMKPRGNNFDTMGLMITTKRKIGSQSCWGLRLKYENTTYLSDVVPGNSRNHFFSLYSSLTPWCQNCLILCFIVSMILSQSLIKLIQMDSNLLPQNLVRTSLYYIFICSAGPVIQVRYRVTQRCLQHTMVASRSNWVNLPSLE